MPHTDNITYFMFAHPDLAEEVVVRQVKKAKQAGLALEASQFQLVPLSVNGRTLTGIALPEKARNVFDEFEELLGQEENPSYLRAVIRPDYLEDFFQIPEILEQVEQVLEKTEATINSGYTQKLLSQHTEDFRKLLQDLYNANPNMSYECHNTADGIEKDDNKIIVTTQSNMTFNMVVKWLCNSGMAAGRDFVLETKGQSPGVIISNSTKTIIIDAEIFQRKPGMLNELANEAQKIQDKSRFTPRL